MPKSKLRKKVQESHAHEEQVYDAEPHGPLESPSWLAPVMVANFLIGLFWIVIFYDSLSDPRYRCMEHDYRL
jgi:hypothetical protein